MPPPQEMDTHSAPAARQLTVDGEFHLLRGAHFLAELGGVFWADVMMRGRALTGLGPFGNAKWIPAQ